MSASHTWDFAMSSSISPISGYFFSFLTEFLSRSPEGNRVQVFSPGWLDGWAVSRYLPYRAMQS